MEKLRENVAYKLHELSTFTDQNITSYEWEFRNDNPLFLQNSTTKLSQSFSLNNKDANTYNFLKSDFKNSNLLSTFIDHNVTSCGWEIRNDNHSFLQNSTSGLAPSFSFDKRDANTYNLSESNFKNNSHLSTFIHQNIVSCEWEFRNFNPSSLQNNTIGLAPSFSFNDRDANTYNLRESDFKDSDLSSFVEIVKQ